MRRKAAFLNSISAKTSPVERIATRGDLDRVQFASATSGGNAELMPVKVSDSDLDDLMVSSMGDSEIKFVSRLNDSGSFRDEVSTITSNLPLAAVLPVRLNLDGMNDVGMLHQGSLSPSAIMSPPSAVFWVNPTNDTFTCVANNEGECSLRGAIIEANANPGNDIIGFGLPLEPYFLH